MKLASILVLSTLCLSACAPNLFDNTETHTSRANGGVIAKSAPDALIGEWQITSINGAPVTVPDSPASRPQIATLSFQDGTIGAYVFCNQIGGQYTATPGIINVTNTLSTLMACPDVQGQETAVANILRKASTFNVSGGVLTVSAANGDTLKAKR